MSLSAFTLHRGNHPTSRETKVTIEQYRREGIGAYPDDDPLAIDNDYTRFTIKVDGNEVTIYCLHDSELEAIAHAIYAYIGMPPDLRLQDPVTGAAKPYPAEALTIPSEPTNRPSTL